tara:strand:- start:4897 stop:5532 length:636 start_codon:yes stop_codon:yes gene_type:complete
MATVEPKFSGVSPAQPQGAYFTVSIAQGAFSDAASTAGGRVSPCGATDFATAPTTLAESTKISRGQLRWKLMMNALGIRSNFRVVNIVCTYASDAGDTPITTLAFGLVFENPDFVPTTGTTIDGSTTTTTKAEYIRDKIAEALNADHTENMTVYDPTSGAGLISNDAVTVAQVMAAEGEIVEAITVTAVSGFAANTSGQLATDTSLTYSAE